MATGTTQTGVRLIDSAALRDEIIEAISVGVPMRTALCAAGLSPWFWPDWLHASRNKKWDNGYPVAPASLTVIEDFCARVEQARAAHTAQLIRAVHHAAVTINEKTGVADWRAAQFYLRTAGHTRDDWHDHVPPPATPTDRGPRNIPSMAELSEAKLIELAGNEFREILG